MADIYGPHGQVLKAVPVAERYRILNNNWFDWTPGYFEILQNPGNISIETLDKMQMDETVASGLQFSTLAVLSRLEQFTHHDRKIEEFIGDCLQDMDSTLAFYISEIMTARPFGFSVSENVWKQRTDGKVGLADIQTLHPASISFEVDRKDRSRNKNGVSRIFQHRNRNAQVEIPRSKAVLYTHERRFGNPYGVPVLRTAWAPWYLKRVMLKAWALTMERYGSPLMLARVKNGHTQVDIGNGTRMSGIDFVNMAMQQLINSTTAAVDDGTTFEAIRAGVALGGDFDQIIRYLNKMIYRAMLLPSLIADHGDNGSYALGKTHFDLYVMVLEHLAREVAAVLIDQVVTPLILFNFGPQKNYGKWRIRPFRVGDLQALANTFLVLTNAGYISPDDQDDFDFVREEFGLVMKPLEEFTPRKIVTPEVGGQPGSGRPEQPKASDGAPADQDEWAQTRYEAGEHPEGEQPLRGSMGVLTEPVSERRAARLRDAMARQPAFPSNGGVHPNQIH